MKKLIKSVNPSPDMSMTSLNVSKIPLNYPFEPTMNFENEVLQSNLHPNDPNSE